MQSFSTDSTSSPNSKAVSQPITVCRVEDLPSGTGKTIELSEGRELALYNVHGEFYATDNFCPHKGAPLAAGTLCDAIIECYWHGWEFDVRTGECLTVPEKLETYEVTVEEGWIKVRA
jgi:nitrite reductase/ring-hydroxylating ferredoxin subunit